VTCVGVLTVCMRVCACVITAWALFLVHQRQQPQTHEPHTCALGDAIAVKCVRLFVCNVDVCMCVCTTETRVLVAIAHHAQQRIAVRRAAVPRTVRASKCDDVSCCDHAHVVWYRVVIIICAQSKSTTTSPRGPSTPTSNNTSTCDTLRVIDVLCSRRARCVVRSARRQRR
jgi:hypothetical protein